MLETPSSSSSLSSIGGTFSRRPAAMSSTWSRTLRCTSSSFLSHCLSGRSHILLASICRFQVYNSSLPDIALANRAKVNFAQCCMWLKTFSASWPSASHHKTFFEGREYPTTLKSCSAILAELRSPRSVHSHLRRSRPVSRHRQRPSHQPSSLPFTNRLERTTAYLNLPAWTHADVFAPLCRTSDGDGSPSARPPA